MNRQTVAVDFDGVLHSYTTPWKNPETIPDPPVPGAIEWLKSLFPKFNVVVFTARAQTPAGKAAVREWLAREGIYHGEPLEVSYEKKPAIVYVDDRGYRFTGANWPSIDEIYKMKPWWKTVERGKRDRCPVHNDLSLLGTAPDELWGCAVCGWPLHREVFTVENMRAAGIIVPVQWLE